MGLRPGTDLSAYRGNPARRRISNGGLAGMAAGTAIAAAVVARVQLPLCYKPDRDRPGVHSAASRSSALSNYPPDPYRPNHRSYERRSNHRARHSPAELRNLIVIFAHGIILQTVKRIHAAHRHFKRLVKTRR